MIWKVAAYCRISREDGDKAESDSIANQQKLLKSYITSRDDMSLIDVYSDDGYTGTNFDRPHFQRMMGDIEAGHITCVIVKDLSRFGRDYIDVGRYLERVFPSLGVRFVAISDNVDSQKGSYDMMLPLKNVFNEQYARDISQKVKASLRAKQKSGQFIGAFASYGYLKDALDKNHLVVDPVAAITVRRIFRLYEHGMGKISIAKALNQEGIPCPSVYKEQMGQKYHNGQRISKTTYWTYTTIHRMLSNQIYAGHMLTGVYVPTEGTVLLNNVPLNGKKTHQFVAAGVARTFQNIRLFKQMSVIDNVKAAFTKDIHYNLLDATLRTPKFWKAEEALTEKAMDLLAICKLEHQADAIAANLPYGQQRKLEIARALATDMKVLLLDEPAAGMNPTETAELLACINTIRQRFGIAILLIEHDMSLVMNVCERIQVIDYGQTIAAGLPEQIAQNPKVIAAYLGE